MTLGLLACGTPSAAPPPSPPSAAELLGTTWTLVAPVGDSTPAAAATPGAPEPRRPFIVLDTQSPRVSGFNGCNRLMGSYALQGQSLSLANLASTRMACLPGSDQEQVFMAALSQVRAWHIEDRWLILSNAAGQALLRLQAGPGPR